MSESFAALRGGPIRVVGARLPSWTRARNRFSVLFVLFFSKTTDLRVGEGGIAADGLGLGGLEDFGGQHGGHEDVELDVEFDVAVGRRTGRHQIGGHGLGRLQTRRFLPHHHLLDENKKQKQKQKTKEKQLETTGTTSARIHTATGSPETAARRRVSIGTGRRSSATDSAPPGTPTLATTTVRLA